MKRKSYIFLISMMLLLSGCGETKTDVQEESSDIISEDNSAFDESRQSQREDPKDSGTGKTLVAYFSWADNAVQDNIDAMTSASVKTPGNVAQLVDWIAEETDGDLFSIQVSESYPADWDGCLARANEEKADNIHPELVQSLDNMEDYDTVFLGYPNWWYSCPMAIHSFLDTHDLGGKQVYLFCSHGTGGLANSVNDIAEDIPEAVLSEDVFHVYEDDTALAKEDIISWVKGLKN